MTILAEQLTSVNQAIVLWFDNGVVVSQQSRGQSFSVAASSCTSISLRIARFAMSGANADYSIYLRSGSTTGTVLASVSFNSSVLTTVPTFIWKEFTFDAVELAAGTTYYITLEADGVTPVGSTPIIAWRHAESDVYENGQYYEFEWNDIDGGVWEADANLDFTFKIEGEFALPQLENPTEDGTNYYLNKDWLLEMRWSDGAVTDTTDYTVYFAATGDPEFLPRTDRTRYSIVVLKMFLDVELDYSTTYLWFVRKDLGGGNFVDSETWSFTTMAYAPPTYSTRTRPPYGGGADITVPTGENNMITVERLIAIAQNKFYYEDV